MAVPDRVAASPISPLRQAGRPPHHFTLMLMYKTDDLHPEIPSRPVIPVNTRVELVQGEIYGVDAVFSEQLMRLVLNLHIQVAAHPVILAR